MAFITWTALLTGCEKWFGNKPDKMPGDTTVGGSADTGGTMGWRRGVF